MINVIIDTDIGADSDDAVALSLAIKLHKKGIINLMGICACARKFSSATVNAILKSNGVECPTAKSNSDLLECDKKDFYAEFVAKKYKQKDSEQNGVDFFRKLLSQSNQKVVIVGIGPQNTLADLLKSSADKHSKLNGVQLVSEKVEKVFLMGGNFNYNNPSANNKDYFAEWNICQDIQSAQYFNQHCPVPIVYAPFEVGVNVITGENFTLDCPERDCLEQFHINCGGQKQDRYGRSSWDAVTLMQASGLNVCKQSEWGSVEINDQGYTRFVANGGNQAYLIKIDDLACKNSVNKFLVFSK